MTVATKAAQRMIIIEPDWVNLARWQAHMLAEHGFEKNALSPVAAFVDTIRYLTLKDIDAVNVLITELRGDKRG